MQTLTSFLRQRLPGGLPYDDAAQLCLRIHCYGDCIPSALLPLTALPGLADVFAELAQLGWVRDQDSLMRTFYGAERHEVTNRGHWVEVIASLYKKGGGVVDHARAKELAIRVGLCARQIRITCTPPGEAPEQIRSAWAGLTLPLAFRTPSSVETVGVVSKPKTRLGLFLARVFGRTQRQTGYAVEASKAIDLLAAHSAEAAQWWRQHAPRAIAPGELFLFAAEACQEMTP